MSPRLSRLLPLASCLLLSGCWLFEDNAQPAKDSGEAPSMAGEPHVLPHRAPSAPHAEPPAQRTAPQAERGAPDPLPAAYSEAQRLVAQRGGADVPAADGAQVKATAAGAQGGKLHPGMKWFWQLGGESVQLPDHVDVYDIDLFDKGGVQVPAGKIKICYFSAGTLETDNKTSCGDEDAKKIALKENIRKQETPIPFSAIGQGMGSGVTGGDKECYLDIRDDGVFKVMEERLRLAKSQGCDGVEPDNVDSYGRDNKSGFGLTQEDSVAFVQKLSKAAHEAGLLIGLKNGSEIVSRVIGFTDFVLVEGCEAQTAKDVAEYGKDAQNECDKFASYVGKGKPVFQAEYTKRDGNMCVRADQRQFSLSFFPNGLNGKFETCR